MVSDDPYKELAKTFDKTMRPKSITMMMNDTEYKERIQIQKQHKEIRIEKEHLYRAEYPSRVANEAKALMRKDGAKTRDYKPRFGMDDRFNGGNINLQAEKIVRGKHKITMANLREAERNDLGKLYDRVEHRNNNRGKAKTDFNKTTNRRSGADRRNQVRTGPKR